MQHVTVGLLSELLAHQAERWLNPRLHLFFKREYQVRNRVVVLCRCCLLQEAQSVLLDQEGDAGAERLLQLVCEEFKVCFEKCLG